MDGTDFLVAVNSRFTNIAMKLLWVMSLANDLSYTRRIMVLYSFALYFSYSASKANLLPSLNLATNRVSFSFCILIHLIFKVIDAILNGISFV